MAGEGSARPCEVWSVAFQAVWAARTQTPAVRVRPRPTRLRRLSPAVRRVSQALFLVGAAVAEFEAAAAAAGDLGDDPFHVGPELAVLLPQFGLGGPVTAGLAQQVVSLVQNDFAAGLGRGAPLTQRAVAAQRTEAGHPGLG